MLPTETGEGLWVRRAAAAAADEREALEFAFFRNAWLAARAAVGVGALVLRFGGYTAHWVSLEASACANERRFGVAAHTGLEVARRRDLNMMDVGCLGALLASHSSRGS